MIGRYYVGLPLLSTRTCILASPGLNIKFKFKVCTCMCLLLSLMVHQCTHLQLYHQPPSLHNTRFIFPNNSK